MEQMDNVMPVSSRPAGPGRAGRRRMGAGVIVAVDFVILMIFLILPMIEIFRQSFSAGEGATAEFYQYVFRELQFGQVLRASVIVSGASALISTGLAFVIAYTVTNTTLPGGLRKAFHLTTLLPMLLPTITYGFAIIYAFGKQGLITKLIGRQFFDIYGYPGMMIGFIVYTLPVAYVLLRNTMRYIDPKYRVLSKTLGDKPLRTFLVTTIRPLIGTFAASVIQCFFLCFTDYGIPMAVGGRVEVVATALYDQMLGSVPNFHTGSAVAVIMLLPSAVSILLLAWVERYNIRYRAITKIQLRKNTPRDVCWGIASAVICLVVIGIFATVFVVAFVKGWPYDITPTFEHFRKVFSDSSLIGTYWNSIIVAVFTALVGTLVVYGAGLVSVRSELDGRIRRSMDVFALVINTIPGMVLGIAYMLLFSGTALQNTFPLIILCTVIHYFSTPYLMAKGSLEKMDSSWETTGRLMGDSWMETVIRVVTPNAAGTLAEIFRYYFVNAMVTVSAVIFLVGADTMVITAKIKELEHYQQFDDIFVLSILILVTNLAVTGLIDGLGRARLNAGAGAGMKKKGHAAA